MSFEGEVRFWGCVLCVMVLSGCQTPPDVQALNNQKKTLQQQLQRANGTIEQLEARKYELEQNIAELRRVMGVLGTEKNSRVSESSALRGQVRKFVQHQIDGLKDFLVAGNLLDYVGGELVERQHRDDKPLLLVDLGHPIPANGALTGVGAHFIQPTTMVVKVLRQVEGRLVVIWESKHLQASQPGLLRISFPVSVGVEKGDVIGYYFPDATAVSYDTGTGNTLYRNQDLALGSLTSASALSGKSQRRAYSLGVYGLLN